MRVAICVPSGDEVKTDFWLSYHELLIEMLAARIEPMLLNVRTSSIANSRFYVVRDALSRAADKVLFIDTDMTFPGDALSRLLARGKPIVGATYVRRRPGPSGQHTVLGYGRDDVPPGAVGPWPMARMPLGMMLIDARVFARVPRPWFVGGYVPELDDIVSEDYAFCDAAVAAGYEIWCDLDLSHDLGHLGQKELRWERSLSATAAG